MSNEILFRTQLASIMEVLANAAVEEICKLVDDGYAVLHLQMSECQKENEALKMRLHLMELKAVRRCAESADGALAVREKRRTTAKEVPTVAGNRVRGCPGEVCLQGLHTAVEEDNSATAFSLQQVHTAEAENGRSKSILIKDETPVEYSDPHVDLKIPVQGALDSGAGDEDGVLALGLMVSSAESSEELPEQHRAGHRTAVWEVSGLEAVLRLQAENVGIRRLGNAGLERGAGSERGAGQEREAGRLSTSSSQPAATYEAPRRIQTLADTEAKGQSRPFRRGNSERHPALRQLRSVSSELTGAHVQLSPSNSVDLIADVVLIDSVKEEAVPLLSDWDKEPTAPGRTEAQHRPHRDDRDTEESVNPSSLSRVWPTGGEIAAAESGGLNGLAACERDFSASGNLMAGCNDSTKEKRFICRYCGKGFSRQNALEIHQRVHTGEKPFRCTQCGKRFSDSSNLRRHQSVHSRERPFSCTQCERSFSHHYQLKVHQRVHTGDRPFSCAHCGKKFGERSFLKLHQQREHTPLYVA